MISPISFGSVYVINANDKSSLDQQIQSSKVNEYCKQRKIPYFEDSQYFVRYPLKKTKYSVKTTIFNPDSKDGDIEIFLATKGIKYTKYETAKLLNPEAVIKRVKAAPKGYKTAVIDSEKLEKILLRQEDNNYYSTKSVYKNQHKKETQFMLKSLDAIPASTLHITTWYDPDQTINDIKQSNIAEENSIVINFERQSEDDPDHCMYFAMQGAGMRDIPVYFDDESYRVADALGIIKQTL